jgi:serine/threonine protein kinase
MKVEEFSPANQIAAGCREPKAAKFTPVDLKPGAILDDRFHLLEVISDGGMATVFKAEDLHHGDHLVAVKVPHKHYEINLASFSAFQHEEEIGRRLDHPYVLKFFPVKGGKSRPYLVMEYVHGCTLADQLGMFTLFPEQDALAITALICEGLQYLHEQGVTHRDLKPANIMICTDETIRIVDFGIACATDSPRSAVGAGFGTPHYMSPERARRRRGDARADIYSLGAMLYELLTGAVPFANHGEDLLLEARLTGDPVAPRKLNPKISPQTEEIVLRALDRDPANRYPSAAALLRDLNDPGQVKVTGRADRLQPSTLWKRNLRRARWITLWALLPIIGQAVLFFLLWHHLAKK